MPGWKTVARTALASTAALAALVTSARAQDEDRPKDGGTFSLVVENDYFGGTDRNYTNGIVLGYTSGPSSGGLVGGLANILPLIDHEGELRYSLAAGQSIFTPEDTDADIPDPDDRPYAAWLYGAFGVSSETEHSLTTYELNLGIVGPSAGGEDVQNGVHDLIDDKDAQGWDYQLEDEFGYMLIYDKKWRGGLNFGIADFAIDFIPHISAAAGNVMTYAGAGGTFRLGTELDLDYGPPRVRPSLGGSRVVKAQNGFRWYLFAGAEGRAVAQNIFLDGNTDNESRSVDKLPLTYDIQAGAALQFGRFTLAYTNVYRSKEFDDQDDGDRFGAVSLSYTF